jgi:hypothetical protein
MNTELVARLADAHARIYLKGDLEKFLASWRGHPEVEKSWGCTNQELREAVEIAVEIAPETLKELFSRG